MTRIDSNILKQAFDSLSEAYLEKPSYTLVFSRVTWESEAAKQNGYIFTKEELDEAEKLEVKFIGERNGVKCYLPPTFSLSKG